MWYHIVLLFQAFKINFQDEFQYKYDSVYHVMYIMYFICDLFILI